ncbi:AAA family ATPase [Emcibacteraceae bacterium]|nr:AAA family ATPase [Emcibacteraceae bacterium]
MIYSETELKEIVSSLESFEAICIVSFYLAQPGEKNEPYKALGYLNHTEAFTEVGEAFGRKPSYMKNMRDTFDRVTDSNRVGWENGLRGNSKLIHHKYKDWHSEDLLNLTKIILSKTWINMEESKDDIMNEILNDDLPELSQCIEHCARRAEKISVPINLVLPANFLSQLIHNYNKYRAGDKVILVSNHTIFIQTPDNNFLAISMIEISRCWAIIPYARALKKYVDELDSLITSVFRGVRTSGSNKELFKKLPSTEWEDTMGADRLAEINHYLDAKFASKPEYAQRFRRFLSDVNWTGISKKLDRADLLISTITTVGGWLSNASDRRGDLCLALIDTLNAETVVQDAIEAAKNNLNTSFTLSQDFCKGGHNKIYYGAPGTGKSYKINQLTKTSMDTVIKAVFHADTQNSDFVGCLKPSSDGDNITYKFQPGPFTTALVNAFNDPSKMHYLVIEEINRASAAAVFGEVFQLLDRNETGRTEVGYEITPSDPMHSKFLDDNRSLFDEKIFIPSNLTILATMNSSDQAVMPMDTAFKRRWGFEYVPLDFKHACTKGSINIVKALGVSSFEIEWKDFASEINKILTNLEIPEDRHIGPFFVTEDELINPEKSSKTLSGKIFMYLWDDVLRHNGRHSIFDTTYKTNGALMSAFKSGKPVFNSEMLDVFTECSQRSAKQSSELSSEELVGAAPTITKESTEENTVSVTEVIEDGDNSEI